MLPPVKDREDTAPPQAQPLPAHPGTGHGTDTGRSTEAGNGVTYTYSLNPKAAAALALSRAAQAPLTGAAAPPAQAAQDPAEPVATAPPAPAAEGAALTSDFTPAVTPTFEASMDEAFDAAFDEAFDAPFDCPSDAPSDALSDVLSDVPSDAAAPASALQPQQQPPAPSLEADPATPAASAAQSLVDAAASAFMHAPAEEPAIDIALDLSAEVTPELTPEPTLDAAAAPDPSPETDATAPALAAHADAEAQTETPSHPDAAAEEPASELETEPVTGLESNRPSETDTDTDTDPTLDPAPDATLDATFDPTLDAAPYPSPVRTLSLGFDAATEATPEATPEPAPNPEDGPTLEALPPLPAGPTPPRLSRSGVALRLQARALEHERFDAAATAVVTEMAQLLGCERVSVGFHHQGRIRVSATSHGGDMQQQQALLVLLAAAMHEALDQHSPIVHPTPHHSAPGLTLAHAELARHNGRLNICTVPITNHDRLFGAFVLERSETIDDNTLDAAKDAASFVGPLLEMKHRLNQPLGGRLADTVAPPGRRIGARVLRTPVLVAAASAVALVVLAVWPTTLRVLAPARVEGAGQRVVAAPVDGFVASVAVRPGESVKAGQVLLTLEDRDLALERDKWAAEASQLDKLYREALTQDEAAAIVQARSKLEQAQAQLGLLQRQMERARITAPIDGVVLSGDLSQAMGSPVKRGQELMTVAPDQRFRIVAEVSEQDISQVQLGQQAQVMFGALVGQHLPLQVSRIAPVATTVEQGNVFEVDALPPPQDAGQLRPGMRGVVRIDIEPSTLGAVWWQRALQAWQRLQWRWLG